nr:reverse transcriptase domain-containing protein [Tanacetum cinerariifolium]
MREIEREWDEADRADRRRPVHTEGTHYTEDEDDQGEHWKSRSKKQRPVEIHHIKQRERESTEAFMERFKTESMLVNGAPECMRVSGFMHGITNPDLIKRLNDNILNTMDEIMSVTTAFLRGEVVVTNQSRKKGQLSYLIKELKQGPNKGEHAKTAKKAEASIKEKAALIFIIQPWKRIMKQRVTQTFSPNQEISFPYLTSSNRRENPMIIEAEIKGHSIHYMYIDGGSASEILGEISWPLGQISLTVSLGDPEDHLKIFQTTAKIERPCRNTPHQAKRKESMKAFMECFKTKSMHVNGAPECMRVLGFMHGITNPNLIKRLNDNILNTVDEMMSVTTAFLGGEVAVANQSRKKGPPTWKHNETGHRSSFEKRLEFKNQHKSRKMYDRFTPLIKTPKEILAMEAIKFKASPPMTGQAKTRNKNKFCEFHGDKRHNPNECLYLRKQIEKQLDQGSCHTCSKSSNKGPTKENMQRQQRRGSLK